MSEKKYRVKTDKSVCYIGTKKECEVYLTAFVDGHNYINDCDDLEVDGSVVQYFKGDTVIYMEEMQLPSGFACMDMDGNEWSFFPSTENVNVSLITGATNLQYVCNLDVEQAEKLKACLDAWLLYMKG